jgi:hypothetical protein
MDSLVLRKQKLFSPMARVLRGLVASVPLLVSVHSAVAAEFVKPTAEELSMTALKGYPGAPAVVLFTEEITKDDLHSVQTYRRVKILTEEGKKYANVELGYVSTGGAWEMGDNKTVEDIVGRTIHPDGTIIPFTGKPYLKVLEKANGYKVQEKVFTLPDVEVGSIIEYRYATRIDDYYVEAPVWMVQEDLFVKEAHFMWYPTSRMIMDEEEQPINSISWFPILPAGAKIDHREIPGTGIGGGPNQVYEMRVQDVPPRVQEEYMPPIRSFSYRVNFSFTPYRNQQEYWAHRGKVWSKRVNKFAGPSGALKEATAKITAGANTPDEKLQKIYEAVMKLENTQFTREHEKSEDKAAGVGQTNDAADVLAHGRGTPAQITELFVGMARAAGLGAYAMWVPDREQELFTPMWMDTRQLDDYIAIVNVNGKELYFDPGSRYCAYGQLAWQHTAVSGLRQTDGGSSIGTTPFEPYKSNRLTRVANLTMTREGRVTGKIDLTFTGAEAVRWRQAALRGDEEGLRKELREHAEAMVPKSLELEIAEVKELTSYDKPLAVSYKVQGTLGSSMGKRVMLPADVFLANASATFPHEKRETAVYFHYPHLVLDAVRINLPQEWAVEALPASAKYSLPNLGVYDLEVTQGAASFTTRRQFAFGDVYVLPKEYTGLRSFYSQVETKDQETVILKPASAVTASNTSSPKP